MFKRRILAALAAAFLLAFVPLGPVACTDADDTVTITVGMLPDLSAASPAAEYYAARIEVFERDHPEYKIVSSPYDYHPDTVVAKTISGRLPTVFVAEAAEAEWLASGGYIASVGAIPDELGWTEKADPQATELLTAGGALYGVPRAGQGTGLLLNLELLAAAGLIAENDGGYALYAADGSPLYPTDFDALAAFAAAVRARSDGAVSGLMLLSDEELGGKQFENLALGFGGGALQNNDNGRWVARMNTAACVSAMRWVQDMSSKKLLYAPSGYLGRSELYGAFGGGKVAMALCYNSDVNVLLSAYDMDDKTAFVPLPTAPDAATTAVVHPSAYLFSSRASAAQIRGALLFLKYIGRSPETDAVGREAFAARRRFESAAHSSAIPEIPVWTDADYAAMAAAAADDGSPAAERYRDFADVYARQGTLPVKYFGSAMYRLLDDVIGRLLVSPNAYNVYTLLSAANSSFQTRYLDRLASS